MAATTTSLKVDLLWDTVKSEFTFDVPRIEISGSNRLEQLPPVPINISRARLSRSSRGVNTNLFSSSAQRVNALINDREFLRGEPSPNWSAERMVLRFARLILKI